MSKRNIIVIGASAGGAKAIVRIIRDLPRQLDATVCVVWHMGPNATGALPQMINSQQTLPAVHPNDGDLIEPGHVYVAPPDRHLLIQNGTLCVTNGPKENRFRPAIDPLFRSAAYAYGTRVIGVILSGALDDGTAGLSTIQRYGGITIVQDPADAEVKGMPESAIAEVKVDYKLPADKIGALLADLVNTEAPRPLEIPVDDEQLKMEVDVAMDEKGNIHQVFDFGIASPFTCPECHGVLAYLREGNRVRFRCHTGHAFSASSLLDAINEQAETSIWNAVRSVQESAMLLNHIGDHFAERNFPKLAALYFRKANEAEERGTTLRKALAERSANFEQDIRDEAGTF